MCANRSFNHSFVQTSRTPTHDEHFFGSRAIHGLVLLLRRAAEQINGRCRAAKPGSHAIVVARAMPTEALIYAAGTVKNLSNSEQHQRRLSALGKRPVVPSTTRVSLSFCFSGSFAFSFLFLVFTRVVSLDRCLYSCDCNRQASSRCFAIRCVRAGSSFPSSPRPTRSGQAVANVPAAAVCGTHT